MKSEQLQQIFFVECEEALEAAETGLAACAAGTQDEDTVNAVFRAIHSIKGGAGAFGYVPLQTFTHTFETLLSDVREGAVSLEEALIDLSARRALGAEPVSADAPAGAAVRYEPEFEALSAEIEKLKGEVSRLRGERYRRQLDQVASPGRINT